MHPTEQQYLTIPDVARLTGMTESFWRKAIFERRIEFFKVGAGVRVHRDTLAKWLQARTVQAGSRQEGQ